MLGAIISETPVKHHHIGLCLLVTSQPEHRRNDNLHAALKPEKRMLVDL